MPEEPSKKFIKENYVEMYQKWKSYGGGDFYHGSH